MFTQLKGLFSPQAVAMHLKALPKLKSSIMDNCFPARPQNPFAVVGISDVLEIVGTAPVVRRGGLSTPVGSGSISINMLEPLPVKPSKDVTGQDLNNLRMIMADKASLDAWTRGTIDYLRTTCRQTTEGIAATALTGTISWPVKMDGGWDTYEVEFGAPLRENPAKPYTAEGVGMADVMRHLSDMETAIQEGGYGGDIEFLAGKEAFLAIFALAENFKSTAKIRVSVEGDAINIGTYTVRKMSERYRDPKTGNPVAKVPDGEIVGYAKDAPAKIIYCALDDVDAKLQPYPFFPKPVTLPEGNGYRIIGQSKPLPCRSPKSICWGKVA
ncbi:major capsid protein [Pseudodesulfovibrio methanolicus]|uniref:Major capsid protein n=1 Tax=Pseudodesulfovibrio methanolicus TaxID=3126690 RepID=A0ABZ2IZE6_9BACT